MMKVIMIILVILIMILIMIARVMALMKTTAARAGVPRADIRVTFLGAILEEARDRLAFRRRERSEEKAYPRIMSRRKWKQNPVRESAALPRGLRRGIHSRPRRSQGLLMRVGLFHSTNSKSIAD